MAVIPGHRCQVLIICTEPVRVDRPFVTGWAALRFDVLACPEDRTTPESLFLPEASERP
jgi:hypothetical protein